MSNTRTA